MPKLLAIGLGTVCVVAAVLLYVSGYLVAAIVALIAGTAFDLLFVKALRDERRVKP
jgi:Flp pilus assembly protein TadB